MNASSREAVGSSFQTGRGARRRDFRSRVLVVATLAIVLLGAAIAWWPEEVRAPVLPKVTSTRMQGPLDLKENAREAEVRRRFDEGVWMLHMRRYEHAITAFHRVLELSPRMPEAHVNLGFALLGLERWAAARDFFEAATALRRDQANAYYGLAAALEGLKDIPGAMGAMRVYLHRAAPDDPHRAKAEAALWEWESSLGSGRVPDNGPARR